MLKKKQKQKQIPDSKKARKLLSIANSNKTYWF